MEETMNNSGPSRESQLADTVLTAIIAYGDFAGVASAALIRGDAAIAEAHSALQSNQVLKRVSTLMMNWAQWLRLEGQRLEMSEDALQELQALSDALAVSLAVLRGWDGSVGLTPLGVISDLLTANLGEWLVQHGKPSLIEKLSEQG
jgi:hypothetical protein